MRETSQLQYEVDGTNVEHLNNLMSACSAETMADLFNNALCLFAWAALERSQGRLVCSVDEKTGNTRGFLLPALDAAVEGGAILGMNRPNVARKILENAQVQGARIL